MSQLMRAVVRCLLSNRHPRPRETAERTLPPFHVNAKSVLCSMARISCLLDCWTRHAGLLDASPKVQAAAVTVLSQALSVPGLGAETRAALLARCCGSLI